MQQAATQISSDVSPLVRFQEWLKCTQPSTSIRHGCLVDPGEHERDIDDVRKEFREILPVLSFDLDVSELLFGDARKVSRLPVSAHRIIREVLDEFFNVGGCYAQSSKTGFTLVLPNADREIGAMKHDAITVELERRLRAETDPHRARTVNAGAQKRDKALADLFTRALAKMVPGEDPTSTEIELSRLPWGLMCRYSPMWLVRNKLLTSYVCRPMQDVDGGGVQLSQLSLEQTTDPSATTQLDLPMLAQASRDLEELIAQKQNAIVVVPVHFMTISRRPYSDMFLKYCETIPEESRRFLVLEIVGVPSTLPEFRLRELLQYLKKYCRSMLIRVGPNLKTFDLFLNLKIHAIGIDLGLQIRDEAATMRALDRFAERAGRYGIRTYAIGVRSVSLTTAIVASGFDYISGDVIAPPVMGPRGIREFDTGMLFQ